MCDQCGSELETHGLLTAHLASHRESQGYECDLCGEMFVDSKVKDNHIQAKHNTNKICCKKHIPCEHKEPMHICDQCEYTFRNEGELAKHIEDEHKQGQDNEWNCDGCSFQASEIHVLINHLKITGHQPSKNLEMKKYFNEYRQCFTCKKEFNGYNKLMDHRKDVHPSKRKCWNYPDNCKWGSSCWFVHPEEPMDIDQSPVKPPVHSFFKCNHCGETIKEHGDFMKHKKTKHSDMILPCENFLKGMCMRNEDTCWFKHSPAEISQQGQYEYKNQGFQQAYQNAVPPDQISKLFEWMNSLSMKMENMQLEIQRLGK